MHGLPLTYRYIYSFWLPLAGTWVMMAVEGPYLAAIIARLPSPTENLAAFGVAFSFAIIIEAPVIMLMAASTALVRSYASYLALRRFAYGLGIALTLIQAVAVLPPVFPWIGETLVGLPPEVSRLAHQGLALMLPWPIAIGYRRFRQGLLIRHNLTRRVALGTVLRLTTMTVTALAAAQVIGLRGIHVAALALSVGVVVEAAASRLMTRELVARLRLQDNSDADREPTLTLRTIVHFYVPLGMTSVLGMAIQPAVTFFMGQSRFPLESLAVLPVVHGLTFVFRAMGLSFQEVGIALLGEHTEHYRQLRTFAAWLAIATAGGMSLIVYTPLATVWFQEISGLSPELTQFALLPARILVWIPAGSVWISFQRSVLVHGRDTRAITRASALEVLGVLIVLAVTVQTLSWVGAVGAATAIVIGRLIGNLSLIAPVGRMTRRAPRPDMVGSPSATTVG
ncbi:MAG: hypothetical protein VX427_06540 [Acidobacteriota bacterium]|nr:hypothetical protein [Acidobacteriota bacterium]